MSGSVLKKARYIFPITTPEYDNSRRLLNLAKSNQGAGNYASNEFGIKSPRGDILDAILQNKNIYRRREL